MQDLNYDSRNELNFSTSKEEEESDDVCLRETQSNVWENFELCTPVLTNVLTRNRMAIIKLDPEAVFQLRALARNSGIIDQRSKDHLTWATTDPFTLEYFQQDHMIKIDVIFKLFLDGCSEEAGKFISVFVEIYPHEKNRTEIPMKVAIFLKGTGDTAKHCFKKCFAIKRRGKE